MRDKKDHATFDLPGFDPVPQDDAGAALLADLSAAAPAAAEPKRPVARVRRTLSRQEQLALPDLADTDATGLPVWKHDPDLDLSGLPIWQPAVEPTH
jgi:hypothetical protein